MSQDGPLYGNPLKTENTGAKSISKGPLTRLLQQVKEILRKHRSRSGSITISMMAWKHFLCLGWCHQGLYKWHVESDTWVSYMTSNPLPRVRFKNQQGYGWSGKEPYPGCKWGWYWGASRARSEELMRSWNSNRKTCDWRRSQRKVNYKRRKRIPK